MVLIRLSPFALRRILVLAAAILALSALTCFGQPILFPVKSTPYDQQMERIEPILNCSAISSEHQIPLALVNHWIRDLRAIPYRFSVPWKTPLEVAREAVADCKGKPSPYISSCRQTALRIFASLSVNGHRSAGAHIPGWNGQHPLLRMYSTQPSISPPVHSQRFRLIPTSLIMPTPARENTALRIPMFF